jgi:ribosomal-protein-alanine N-acetyltransferase
VTGVRIRPLHWSDIEAVHAVELESFPESAWSRETFWAELAGVPKTRCYWVAEQDGYPVGYAGLLALPPDADVQTVGVAPADRGHGIGDRLMAELISEARRRECRQLMLEVEDDNDAARRLYDRHGFEPLARRSSYYGPGRDALVLRLLLSKQRAPRPGSGSADD